jgi:Zn-dependent alcohol dehydrogenase
LDPFMVVNKAITILGSTYCAPRDYWRAVKVVEKNWKNFPLVSYVTHKFSLEQTQLGLETVLRGEAVKAVVEPGRA